MSLKNYLNVYEFDTELLGSGENVKYKGLSTNSIKKLLVYEEETDVLKEQDILDSILELSIIDEDFNVENLLVPDRYYLFIKIREATKGSVFQYTYKCSNCGKEQPKSMDLQNVKIVKPEEFQDELKLESLTFKMQIPTRKLQKELISTISKNLSNKEKQVEMGLVDIASLVCGIKTNDGDELELDYQELINFIGDLPEREIEKIDEWRHNNELTINLSTDVKCNGCGNEEKVTPSLTNFFS